MTSVQYQLTGGAVGISVTVQIPEGTELFPETLDALFEAAFKQNLRVTAFGRKGSEPTYLVFEINVTHLDRGETTIYDAGKTFLSLATKHLRWTPLAERG